MRWADIDRALSRAEDARLARVAAKQGCKIA
jgi:hypothetical protein